MDIDEGARAEVLRIGMKAPEFSAKTTFGDVNFQILQGSGW